MIEVDRVDTVTPSAITVSDARKAGYTTVAALLADLKGAEGQPIFRIRFRRLAEPDPRGTLAAARTLSESDRAEISTRLARLDRAGRRGEWTEATLSLIGRSPGVVASALAHSLGLPTDVFKRDVRKLTALGLTTSLATGYRLSPRGTAYLSSRQSRRSGLGDG